MHIAWCKKKMPNFVSSTLVTYILFKAFPSLTRWWVKSQMGAISFTKWRAPESRSVEPGKRRWGRCLTDATWWGNAWCQPTCGTARVIETWYLSNKIYTFATFRAQYKSVNAFDISNLGIFFRIELNHRAFEKKKTQILCEPEICVREIMFFLEKFTPLAKILHCCCQWQE